jgi:hypothetical protein
VIDGQNGADHAADRPTCRASVPREVDLGLYDLLAGVLPEADLVGTPIALLLAAFTDARVFTPMQLPPEMRFTELIHPADDCIPVDAVRFGSDAAFRVLERYGR